jgi:hypothetical protein
MSRILEISRPLLSTLLFVVLMISVIPLYSQRSPAGTTPAEPQSQAAPNNNEPNKDAKRDLKTELPSSATPQEMRQAQIEADTKKLYQLSAELRAEVAKTYKESLSLTVLKKAQEVEKLAKSLKAEMNQEVAAAKH